MKSLIVLERAFLAVEFLFYSFRALSTYIFETYFTFFSPEFYPKLARFVRHVLGKSAPGFRWKELLICSKILSKSVAEKAVINEPLPYFRSQCKFVTLQMLRTCPLQIKSQIPPYFTKSVSRHGIRVKTRSPNYIPQHIIVN